MKKWPRYIERILYEGKRPDTVKIRMCGRVHRTLHAASLIEGKGLTKLRQSPQSAEEVQVACLFGWLVADKSPFEKGKKYWLTDIGAEAWDVLEDTRRLICPKHEWNIAERDCPWTYMGTWRWHGRYQCWRPYVPVPCEVNEEWIEHLKQRRW